MENDLKKLLLCLRWDIDNIEDLNAKRDYISGRIEYIQELVKNCSIPDVGRQSEQLKVFLDWLTEDMMICPGDRNQELVDEYFKSL